MGTWLPELSDVFVLLAEGEAGDAAPASPFGMLIPIAVILGLYMLLVGGPQRAERRKTQQMLDTLKKGDEIMTRSGIYGRVTAIEADGQKITIRIDDHARMTVHRDAIGNVLTDDKKDDSKTDDGGK